MSNEIKILQYNVHLFNGLNLPTYWSGVEFLDEERAKFISDAVCQSDADVIVFQEVWSEKMCNIILDECRRIYPHFFRPKEKRFWLMGSGLLLLSKEQIITARFIKFKTLEGIDRFSAKGFIFAEIFKGNTPYFLVNLHTQADTDNKCLSETRQNNILQVLEYVRKYKDRHLIICGDFNIEADSESCSFLHHEEYSNFNKITKIFGLHDACISNDNCYTCYTWCKDNTQVRRFSQVHFNKRIDLCLHSDRFSNPLSVTQPSENYWMFHSDYKFWKKGRVEDLSDHYPLITILKMLD
jgi:exonuclease III